QVQPGLNKLLVSELMRGEFIEQRENILWWAIPAPARRTWQSPWGLPPAARESGSAFTRSQN
ncbi:hypothetical protein, partial [Gimesia panareensis]|uniref:hypothetical protein n=1 Tax=Gimesia panareensis TaxID=2527978 RepID=UPI001E347185